MFVLFSIKQGHRSKNGLIIKQMRKSSLHKKTRDCVTMTCDYDNDRFPGNAEISALDRNSHGHSQRSWS